MILRYHYRDSTGNHGAGYHSFGADGFGAGRDWGFGCGYNGGPESEEDDDDTVNGDGESTGDL